MPESLSLTHTSSFKYRPEVDGLRAIAVLAVLFFHANLGMQGGYVGVDVFFVISGFLITSLIARDLQQGTFSMVTFWERRARRILPALAVVVLVTLIAGWFLMLPQAYADLGKSAAFQAIFSANFHFWMESGYFTGAAEEKPLLHTWSLAVEEQFYLIFPLILWTIFRRPSWRGGTGFTIGMVSVMLASLILSVQLLSHDSAASFYLLPSRAWELLVGAALALFPSKWTPTNRSLREFAVWLGLAGIVIPCFLYSKVTPFPGFAALAPCLGTALIIWGNGLKGDLELTSLGRFLSKRPVVFVGLISYSLYLWHWPLLAFNLYFAAESFTIFHRVGMLVLSFVLAILSWRFVETPFRRRRLFESRKAIYSFGGVSIATVLILGAFINTMQGLPQRLPPEAQALGTARDDTAFRRDLTVEDILERDLVVIGDPDPDARVELFVWGDSHAMAAMPALDLFLKEEGIAGRAATRSSTAPVLDFTKASQFDREEESLRYNEAVVSYLETGRIPNVILISRWRSYAQEGGTPDSLPFDEALLGTIERLTRSGIKPWIFVQVPNHPIDVPRALARSVIFETDVEQFTSKPDSSNGLNGEEEDFVKKVEAAGARVLDPRPEFLDEEKEHYKITSDGVVLYWDSHHLTKKGAEMMLLPFFRQKLTAAMRLPMRSL